MSIPSYSNACIAPSLSGTSVYLVGVPAANEGTLEVNLINLSSIESPTATFVNQSSFFVWNSAAPKACFAYPGNLGDTNSPVVMQQFGVNSYFTNIYPNGTIDFPTNFQSMGYVSPKLFSFTGAVGTLNWYTAMTNASSLLTNSPWVGVRLNATLGVNSTRDYDISTFPTTSALLSVGTYVASSNTPAQGYHVVFDNQGAGIIYTTLDSSAPIFTSLDRVLTLSSPTPVNMGGIILTSNAFSLTMGSVGYILDKASDGSTVLYSITPGTSSQLQRVSIPGNVPTFSSILTATPLGNQIITFGSSSNGASTFYSFNTVTNAWSGTALVKPNIPSTPGGGNSGGNGGSGSNGGNSGNSSKTPIGAIVGGVVGGLVVIALIAFFVIRHRRRPAKPTQLAAAPTSYQDPSKMHNPAATPLMDQNYVLQQQQMAQNQMVQQQPYQQQPYQQPYQQQQVPMPQQQAPLPQQPYGVQPQQQDLYAFQTQPLSPVQHQGTPVIFQAQTSEPYTYTPPTLVPAAEPVSPNIFQPQNSESSPSATYNQSSYVGPTSSVHSPMTPASQAYTPTSSHTPSNPQFTPAQGDSYAL
ncbi:hypothetical protein EMPS_06002 [Entomortierella parvispora]|uniref:Uncharacterized protein n=1 Tax=Entomortierella parvispora TaxID=205924 RepID=A0A9P3LX14_9FUNG|nr:hypothetical protein EMPS_06002 [Entomortierella parvispora]